MTGDIKQRIALFAAISAFILAAGKILIGFYSGSMTVVTSGLDSLLDVVMSGMNLYAIRKASEPADETHQYGHGKAEDLAGAFQSVVIVLSGCYIIYKAVAVFLAGKPIAYSSLDFIAMAFSLVFSFIISTSLLRIGKKTGSNALMADALHYKSDLYTNTGALLAIILSYYTGRVLFDLVFAAIAGMIIIFSAIRIFRNSISGIMDARLSDDIEAAIKNTMESMSFPMTGFHKLRTRHSGSHKYVDFHIRACRKLQIEEAHSLAHRIEDRIKITISQVDIIVHVEPCNERCDMTEITCIFRK